MEKRILTRDTDYEVINIIYRILRKSSGEMMKKGLFCWMLPYSKRAIRKDCKDKVGRRFGRLQQYFPDVCQKRGGVCEENDNLARIRRSGSGLAQHGLCGSLCPKDGLPQSSCGNVCQKQSGRCLLRTPRLQDHCHEAIMDLQDTCYGKICGNGRVQGATAVTAKLFTTFAV